MTGKKILVVDDEEPIRILLKSVCEKLGHEVHCAEDGQKAFKAITEESYDLILLDIMMPGWDGLSTLKGLNFYKIKTQVIVISGLVADEFREEFEEIQNIVEFVQKPFTMSDIRALIVKTLDD
jgi:CheY-like chemotaxis protein